MKSFCPWSFSSSYAILSLTSGTLSLFIAFAIILNGVISSSLISFSVSEFIIIAILKNVPKLRDCDSIIPTTRNPISSMLSLCLNCISSSKYPSEILFPISMPYFSLGPRALPSPIASMFMDSSASCWSGSIPIITIVFDSSPTSIASVIMYIAVADSTPRIFEIRSASFSPSSARRDSVIEPPGRIIIVVLPKLSNSCSTAILKPCPIEISEITAAIPITIPKRVK